MQKIDTENYIWNEDLTLVYKTLQHIREKGITDLRQYLQENPNILYIMAGGVKLLSVNLEALKLFKATNKGQFFSRINKHFNSDALDIFVEELCAIWDNRDGFCSEVKFTTLDGKEMEAIISYEIPDNPEEFANVTVTIFDISDIKEILKKKKILGIPVSSSMIEIYIFDEELLKFTYANKAACANLEYTLEELKTLTPLDIKPNITPEDFFELTNPLSNKHKGRSFLSTVHQRKNQTTYPVDIHIKSVSCANRNSFIAIAIDKTPYDLLYGIA